MKKWHAEELCSGIEHEYGADVYLASEVDVLRALLDEAARTLIEYCGEALSEDWISDFERRYRQAVSAGGS